MFSLNHLAAGAALVCAALAPAHAQQAFPATLTGHAVMPALTVIPAPADAPADLVPRWQKPPPPARESWAWWMVLSAYSPHRHQPVFDGQPAGATPASSAWPMVQLLGSSPRQRRRRQGQFARFHAVPEPLHRGISRAASSPKTVFLHDPDKKVPSASRRKARKRYLTGAEF